MVLSEASYSSKIPAVQFPDCFLPVSLQLKLSISTKCTYLSNHTLTYTRQFIHLCMYPIILSTYPPNGRHKTHQSIRPTYVKVLSLTSSNPLIFLFIHLPSLRPFFQPLIHPLTIPFIHLSMSLIHQIIHLNIQNIRLSIHQSIYPSIHLSFIQNLIN